MYVNSGARIKASAVGAKSEEPPSEGLTVVLNEEDPSLGYRAPEGIDLRARRVHTRAAPRDGHHTDPARGRRGCAWLRAA